MQTSHHLDFPSVHMAILSHDTTSVTLLLATGHSDGPSRPPNAGTSIRSINSMKNGDFVPILVTTAPQSSTCNLLHPPSHPCRQRNADVRGSSLSAVLCSKRQHAKVLMDLRVQDWVGPVSVEISSADFDNMWLLGMSDEGVVVWISRPCEKGCDLVVEYRRDLGQDDRTCFTAADETRAGGNTCEEYVGASVGRSSCDWLSRLRNWKRTRCGVLGDWDVLLVLCCWCW